jgi:putative transposase
MDIFKDEQDNVNFLWWLKLVLGLTKMTFVKGRRSSLSRIQALPKDAFSILCYCLMPNHFHLLVRQNSELPTTKLLAKVSTSYSKYFNKKYNHVGGVFQDQYKAVLVDNDSYLLWVSAYIHQNPKVAGLVTDLRDYPYSSYLEYLDQRQKTLADKSLILNMAGGSAGYERFVVSALDHLKQRKELESLLLDN